MLLGVVDKLNLAVVEAEIDGGVLWEHLDNETTTLEHHALAFATQTNQKRNSSS